MVCIGQKWPSGKNESGENENNNADKKSKGGIGLYVEAVLFQWINPKAITVTISITAAYTRSEHLFIDVVMLMILSSLWAFGSTITWTLAGVAISRHLTSPKSRKVFNYTMALLLTAAIPPIFFV